MKAVGDFQILQKEETGLRLDASFAIALGIREGVVLSGVALMPESLTGGTTSEGADTENRLMTLIVTPFPQASWARLIRMSVTIDPRPGSLFLLIKALNQLKIFPRHVEDVTGTSLPSAAAESPRATFQGVGKNIAEDDPIVPSATLVLELPRPGGASGDLDELYDQLHKIIEDGKSNAAAIQKLGEALTGKSDRKVTVQWISPMATLNKLSKRSLPVEKIRIGRSPTGSHLEVSLQTWRRQLWRPSLLVPFERSSGNDGTILAMASRDSDEQIIAWYFYEYSDRLVVQFEMIIPALGLEHLWWEYIYDCLQIARGTVLGSASSARIDGRWGVLQCTAMFPLKDSPERDVENIRPIVHCFRKLQGDSSSTKEFEEFKQRLAYEQGLIGPRILPRDAEVAWKGKSLNYSSQLERLVVRDPFENSPAPRFHHLFAENPFSFTLPLWLDKYKQLYGELEAAGTQRTRRRLAESIIEKLLQSPGDNIAIVGAHRAGKTTVLNLVYDLLVGRLKEKEDTDDVTLIPIRINASVTPPHMLFTAIQQEMSLLKGKVEKLADTLTKFLKNLTKLAGTVLSSVEVEIEGVKLKPGATVEAVHSLLAHVEEEKKALPELLRISLLSLSNSLKSETGEKFRLVVVMDEFSELTAWGDARTLAVWRHAVESREFSHIKWLFSTTRPVKEAVEYSPITNLFLEVNVGSLRKEESQGLIDAFSVTAWKGDPQGTQLLRPVITHPARLFLINITSGLPYLLQVSCYHIYDRATRTSFPLINKELCRRTILVKVLPEMADYLERQWHQIPKSAQDFIMESLPKNLSPDEFLRIFIDRWKIPLDRMPPGSLKALDRSGLRGEDGRCVAPLVAAWLLTRQLQ